MTTADNRRAGISNVLNNLYILQAVVFLNYLNISYNVEIIYVNLCCLQR